MRRLLAALALPMAITACSSDIDGEGVGDVTYEGSYVPACSEIWVVGQVLPADYEGCEDGDSLAAPAFVKCPAGEQYAYTTLDDTSYAIPGQVIVETAGEVADLYADCQGEERVGSGN